MLSPGWLEVRIRLAAEGDSRSNIWSEPDSRPDDAPSSLEDE